MQPNNVSVPIGAGDASGHGFVSTYLNPDLETYPAMLAMLDNSFTSLPIPQESILGDIIVSSVWYDDGDIELSVLEPDNTTVLPGNSVSGNGCLAFENKAAGARIYTTYKGESLNGEYKTFMENKSAKGNTPFSVQIASKEHGVLDTKRSSVGATPSFWNLWTSKPKTQTHT